MAVCEDAPCCGCCGPQVWAAESRAMEEREWEPPEDDWWYDDDVASCEDGNGTGKVIMDVTAFGLWFTVTENWCDACHGEGDHERAWYIDIDNQPEVRADWPYAARRNTWAYKTTGVVK